MSRIKIEVSARHCHLSAKDLEKLFGHGYKLKPVKELSQPGQFAAKETITLKTKDGQIDNIRILGPVRNKTQVELSMTDTRKLKIQPPIRLSGDLADSVGGTLVGPKGEIKIKDGIIIAQRHIHASPAEAKNIGLKNNQKVSVKIGDDRAVTFHNIPVRVDKDFSLAMHVDTDEGNASLPSGVCGVGELILKK